MEGGDEVEQGEDTPFAQSVQDLVNARNGELSEGADGIYLLAVARDSNASVFLRKIYHGSRVRQSGVLDEPGRKVTVIRLGGRWRGRCQAERES